jgi:hypothetical protein
MTAAYLNFYCEINPLWIVIGVPAAAFVAVLIGARR